MNALNDISCSERSATGSAGFELTICTVSFNSATYLRYNRALAEQLNPGAVIRWVVAENSPTDSRERIGSPEPGFDVIQGVGPGHIPAFHHTLALLECVRRTSTRFVLVLDPDLFVIRPGWIEQVIGHMCSRNLAIFGTPWHPQILGKYRYFPSVHFSLFDTDMFDRTDIDFRPDFPDGDADLKWPNGWDPEREYFVRSRLAKMLSRLPFKALHARRHYYTDTGGRLYKKYVDDPALRYEILDPVFDRIENIKSLSALGRLVESVLPDELCYVPKHYRDDSEPFLIGKDLPDVPPYWEQFRWQGQPFCFHVRRNASAGDRNPEAEAELVATVVTRLRDRLVFQANRRDPGAEGLRSA